MDSAIAYEKNAHDFLSKRDQSNIGIQVVQDWAMSLPKGAEVLELACGGGHPITKELENAGLNLWAIDSSETLLSEFRIRFPNIPSKCERVQESDYFNKQFDAVIAVGLLFLLPEFDQKQLIKKVSQHVRDDGRFLFTAPTLKGKWRDLNTGIECHSLGQDEYEKLLESNGFRIISKFLDKGDNNYYDTKKFA